MKYFLVNLIFAIIFFATSNYSHAKIRDLPKENIKAKVVKIINDDRLMYINAEINNKKEWLAVVKDINIKVGKTYEFYMPYAEIENVNLINHKITIPVAMGSNGVVDSKNSESNFGFKTCMLGDNIKIAYESLKKLGINAKWNSEYNEPNSEYKIFSIIIDNYKINDELNAKITITSDFFNSIQSIDTDIIIDDYTDKFIILESLTDIYSLKYGEPDSCSKNEKTGTYCTWNKGDVSISTSYDIDNDYYIISGKIVSLSRVLRSYNNLQERQNEDENELKSIKKDIRYNKAAEAASNL